MNFNCINQSDIFLQQWLSEWWYGFEEVQSQNIVLTYGVKLNFNFIIFGEDEYEGIQCSV